MDKTFADSNKKVNIIPGTHRFTCFTFQKTYHYNLIKVPMYTYNYSGEEIKEINWEDYFFKCVA